MVTTTAVERVAVEFTDWFRLIKFSLSDLPNAGGAAFKGFAAVYAMRDARTGDILKFGKTGEFRGRMYGNYIGGVGGATTERIHRELFGEHRMIEYVEISWIPTNDATEAEKLEHQFRARYKQRTGRWPIWDRKA